METGLVIVLAALVGVLNQTGQAGGQLQLAGLSSQANSGRGQERAFIPVLWLGEVATSYRSLIGLHASRRQTVALSGVTVVTAVSWR